MCCRYEFLAREREVAALQALTPEDVRAWFVQVGVGRAQRKTKKEAERAGLWLMCGGEGVVASQEVGSRPH